MSRKVRIPPLPQVPLPRKSTVKIKPKIEPPAVKFGDPIVPSLADHFRGGSEYLSRFKSMRADQRLSEYQDARRYTESGSLAERELKRSRLAVLEGADNELRVRGK